MDERIFYNRNKEEERRRKLNSMRRDPVTPEALVDRVWKLAATQGVHPPQEKLFPDEEERD